MFKKSSYEWGKSNKPFKQAAKTQAALGKAKRSKALSDAKRLARQAKRASNLESSNPIIRKLAQHGEKVAKKHEVKMRKLETDAKLNELSPELAIQKDRTRNRIEIEKARAKSRTASSTALAAGAAALGRGLSDENNQDDAANRNQELEVMRTIFNSTNPTPSTNEENGLSRGVE